MRISIARFSVCAFACQIAPFRRVIRACLALAMATILVQSCRLWAADDQAEIVEWIRSAEESGLLKVDFYDPQKPTKAYPGWTDFEYTVEYKFNHRTRWKPTKKNTFAVTIAPTFTSIEPIVSHVIKLPSTIDPALWHESVLGRHELDHVAIGSHPRLIMLSTYLLKNMRTLNRSADRVADVTPKWAEDSVTAEVSDRRRAIQGLISTNNEKLDVVTSHGGRVLREREVFFDRLYMKENLDDSKFPYIGEALNLLETDEYRNAKSLFEKP